MTRYVAPPRLSVAVLVLPLTALVVLVLADFVRIGTTPHPCAEPPAAATVALVLSGAPNYRRTRRAVALYRQGRVDHIVFSGAGSGGDSARNLAGEARRLDVPDRDISIEDRARSTVQNFQYACAMPVVRAADRIAIVTDRFHAFRAWATAERQCARAQLCSAAVPGPVSMSRRISETGKLLVYQLLRRATLW